MNRQLGCGVQIDMGDSYGDKGAKGYWDHKAGFL